MGRWSLVTSAVGVVLLLGGPACDDDGSDSSSSGGGSAGSGATGGSSSTSSGTAGNGGTAGCHGDAEAWDQIDKSGISCTNNSDCCVVVNSCLGQGQVVSAEDYGTAGSLWPYCDTDCVWCITPVIEVECREGECVGYVVPPSADGGLEEGYSHCGVDDLVLTLDSPGHHFGC